MTVALEHVEIHSVDSVMLGSALEVLALVSTTIMTFVRQLFLTRHNSLAFLNVEPVMILNFDKVGAHNGNIGDLANPSTFGTTNTMVANYAFRMMLQHHSLADSGQFKHLRPNTRRTRCAVMQPLIVQVRC